jgi:hypothetical protein
MLPGPLPPMIKVTYIILKNKPWRNWPPKLGILTICIGFYCDKKPTSKTMVLWLARTTLSTVLYKIDVCIKLCRVSPKFGERGGTNMQYVNVLSSYILWWRSGETWQCRINLEDEYRDFRLVQALSWSNSPMSSICCIMLKIELPQIGCGLLLL